MARARAIAIGPRRGLALELRYNALLDLPRLGFGQCEDGGQDFLDLVERGEMHVETRPDERLALHMLEQLQERVPEAFDIGDHDRLRMAAELRPGELLYQLFERTDAAGKRHEGIGAVEHQLLPHMHVLDDDQVVDVLQHHFAGTEEFRDNSRYLAAGAERRARDFAH